MHIEQLGKAFKFTKPILSKIAAPESGRDIYRDTYERGLILMVGYGGSKVFYLYKKINGRASRIKIAAFPDLSIEEARRVAANLKNEIAKGNTSFAQPGSKMTLKQLFDKYINDYAKQHKKTWRRDVLSMNCYGRSLLDRKISSIDQQMLQTIFNKIATNNGKVTANRFITLVGTIFNHAVSYNLLLKNPASGIKKHKEYSRDRYLTSEEVPRFLNALETEENEKIRDFILMLLYTGARKSNVLSMNWNDISFEDRTWYIANTKNDRAQLVPLIDRAIEILIRRRNETIGDWVFPSGFSISGHLKDPTHIWRGILERACIEDFRLHDLRRTMGSWMAQNGASSYIIGKALNHKSQRSTDIYARLDTASVRESMGKAISCNFDIERLMRR